MAPDFSRKSLAAFTGAPAKIEKAAAARNTPINLGFTSLIRLLRPHDVTIVAVSLHEWRMHGLFEEASIFRRVWSVTTSAVHHGRLDVDVGFLERIVLYVVALTAERLDGKVEQTEFIRMVRLMALQTVVPGGFVHAFRIHLLGHFIVATQTQVGARCQEQRIQ
jgi:hypothetical protein